MPNGGDLEGSTGQLIPIAAGVKVRNSGHDASWAFRIDVRDNIIYLDTIDRVTGAEEQEASSNWEISADAGAGIELGDRRFEPLGEAEPINVENLLWIGEYDGVPVHVGTQATEPYTDLWLPRCGPDGTYQLYLRSGEER